MADLFGGVPHQTRASPKARDTPPRETRAAIVARHGLRDLRDPRAHKCFWCGASTGLGHGLPHRGEPVVFACKAHFGELQ